jgi:two-component system cell cycle sensor histidine kinase PleC
MIASQHGDVMFASARLAQLGPDVQAAWLRALGDGAARQTGAVLEDRNGAWAIAAAATSIADLRVIVAAPTTRGLPLLLQSIMQFALLAGAPLAAVGALLLLLSQNERRVKLAEAEAERAEAQFKLAADSARAGVFEWRSDEDVIALSEQAAAMLRSPRDTLPLAEFAELPAPEDRPAVEEELRRARRTGALDLRFRVGAGAHLAFIEVRGVAIEDRLVRGPVRFIGSVLDVTPRHAAELRVTRLEHQLRAAIDSFTGPFALWDQRKRLMLWNQAYISAFQLNPDAVRPRASYETIASAAAPRIRREKVHPVDPQIREIELTNGEWLQLVERRTSDGGLVTIGIDITAIKRQEEALKRNDKRNRDLIARLEQSEDRIRRQARDVEEARQRAEEASKAKSAFLANMSHELRTPLTHIIGFSEIMGKELFGPIGSEQYRQYANDIHASGNHLLDLINDILDMAKIEAGKVQLSPRPLDPMEAIETAVRLTRRRADEKGLQIIVDAKDLPEIEADHRAVKQMLINLLSNAIKFTDEGAVMVRGRKHGDGVMLRVADTGCGIPPEQLPRLAKPFEQVETELSRNHSGTGLGLALSKSLAEMHGGELTIESELGKGTIVSIYLPRAFAGVAVAEAAE